MTDKKYYCPILVECPHWLDKCKYYGCQHPEAIAMRQEVKPWRPDWVSIGLWVVIIGGGVLIWFKVVAPIVRFLG